MPNFPPLTGDDYEAFTSILRELLVKSEAGSALIIEKAGHLIHQEGENTFDSTILAALVANSFAAEQMMATMLGETNFRGMYQEGEKQSTLMLDVDEHCLLVMVFRADLSVGVMKYFSVNAIQRIADQLKTAEARSSGVGYDLTDLNVTNPTAILRKSS